MEKTDNFSEIKQEILDRARRAEACKKQYGRAYAAGDMQGLCTVIKDNFDWCCRRGVIDTGLLKKYKEDFAGNEIYVNTDAERGFLLCDGSATVEAYGNATVEACGSATVEACGSATVEAYDNATVEAWGNATVRACGSATVGACGSATVEAYGSATVEACGNATVRAYDNATVEAWGNATVRACGSATVGACGSATVEACGSATVEACGNATVRAYDNATVEAWDSAYCSSWSLMECKLSDNALYRVRSTNTVYCANDSMKFRKQKGGAG